MKTHSKFTNALFSFFVIAAVLISIFSAVGVTPVSAASLVVNSNADTIANNGACTLREAITNANSDDQSGSTDCAAGSGADTITFAGDYTITLTSALPDLSGTLTIDGSGHNVTISGNNAWRTFAIPIGTITLNWLNISGGKTNTAGGAILISNLGNVVIDHCTVSGNTADSGGAIFNQGSLWVHNSTLSNNTGTSRGGAIYNNSMLTINNSTFSYNTSVDGGGISNAPSGTVSVSMSILDHNSVNGGGGGIYNDGALSVNDSTFSSNAAHYGGGINNNGGTLGITRSVFNGNSVTGSGGGMYTTSQPANTVEVSHTTFSNNTANVVDGDGGGIDNWGALRLTNSTFSNNSAHSVGGGIDNRGTLLAINNTFSGNSANYRGGGTYNGTGTASYIHNTFSGNSGTYGGGGIYNSTTGTLNLRNNLLSNSLAGLDCENNGSMPTNENNLISDYSCGPDFWGYAMLGPLGNYGGSTQTIPLLPGSKAIDAAGDCTPYLDPDQDQRGVARPISAACDIGAYEVKEQLGSNFVVNASGDSDDGSCDWFGVGALNCTLREAINAANNRAGADTITFAGDYTITLASVLPYITSDLTINGAGRSVTVSGNHAVRCFHVLYGAVVMLNRLSIINANGDYGAAIYNDGTLTISHSTLSGNSAGTRGGALHNRGTATVSHSTFSGNTTTYQFSFGGAISNTSAGTLTVSNSTFSGNSTDRRGGGIYNEGTATVSHSTFSGNAAHEGGGIYNYDSTLHLINNLIANSTANMECGNTGNIATNLNNLIEDGSCSAPLSGDPLLAPLSSYGGVTQTFALLPGSPAIDAAGDCSPYLNPDQDQRGIARPQGTACDIGAFESQGFTLTKTGGDGQSTLVQTAFPNPLVISVTSATGEPVNGGQVIFTAPTSGASIATTPITLTISEDKVSSTVTANAISGTYSVVASATGAANVTFSLENNPISTTTALTSTPNPSSFGQAVTFLATVTSTGGTPTGSVQFYDDSVPLGTPVTLSNGQASLTTSSLAVGVHNNINAVYSGEGAFQGSSSAPLTQTVETPTAVQLVDYHLSLTQSGLQLEWTLASDVDLLGFAIYRAEQPNGPYTRLTSSLVLAQTPSQLTGSHYVFHDLTALPGVHYYYKLAAVNTGMVEVEAYFADGGYYRLYLAQMHRR